MRESKIYYKIKKICDIANKSGEKENIDVGRFSIKELLFLLSSVKKQVPATIHIYNDDELKCPACKENIGYYIIGKAGRDAIGYCSNCGQKLLFTEK